MQFFSDTPQEALDTLKTLRRIEMKLSSRNVWLGRIKSIDQGVVNSVVTIQLKGGDTICSVITDNSIRRLELELGKDVMAIVKASNVLLGSNITSENISARNILTGMISTVVPGAVNDEITINLPGGVPSLQSSPRPVSNGWDLVPAWNYRPSSRQAMSSLPQPESHLATYIKRTESITLIKEAAHEIKSAYHHPPSPDLFYRLCPGTTDQSFCCCQHDRCLQ